MLLGSGLPPTFDYGVLKTIGLLIFFGIFMVVLLRLVFTKSSAYEEAARMPLDDEPVRERRSDGR